MRERIQLRCEACGNAMLYPRSVDPDLPENVCFIETNECDVCHAASGGFGVEHYFDENRKQIVPDWAA